MDVSSKKINGIRKERNRADRQSYREFDNEISQIERSDPSDCPAQMFHGRHGLALHKAAEKWRYKAAKMFTVSQRFPANAFGVARS
jgi:hypothetical protein